MNPTLAMLLRYGLSALITFGIARGWWTELAGGLINDFVINLVSLVAAALPAIYAALKIDNTPKAVSSNFR